MRSRRVEWKNVASARFAGQTLHFTTLGKSFTKHIKLRTRTPPKLAQTRKEQRCTQNNAETIEKIVQADAFFGEMSLIPR